MIGFEVSRGRRGIRRGEVLSFNSYTWKAFVTLDGSLAAVELSVGGWVPAGQLRPGARVAVMLFDENNPADGVIVGAFGGAVPTVEGLSWLRPTDHFSEFTGWTWATDGIFDGAPSTVDTNSWPGLVRLMNNDITQDHFAYKTVSGNTTITARLSKGLVSPIGLRLDNYPAAQYEQISLVDGTAGGTYRIQYSGSSAVTSYHLDGLTPGFYTLRLVRGSTAVYCYMTKDAPMPMYFYGLAAGSWTPTRAGLIFSQRGVASNPDRVGMVDWWLL